MTMAADGSYWPAESHVLILVDVYRCYIWVHQLNDEDGFIMKTRAELGVKHGQEKDEESSQDDDSTKDMIEDQELDGHHPERYSRRYVCKEEGMRIKRTRVGGEAFA